MERELEIRALRAGDEDAVLRCLASAPPPAPAEVERAGAAAELRPRDRAELDWLLACPGGARAWLAVEGSEVRACALARAFRARVSGAADRSIARLPDVAVAPGASPELGDELLRAFFAETCGPDADVVSFGWPEERCQRARALSFGYEVVRTQELFVRELESDAEGQVPAGVETVERFDEQVLWLYDRCSGEVGLSAVRDAAYFDWRYARHPRRRYEALGARDPDGILRGLAVVRESDWPRAGSLAVAEWLVPAAEPEVGARLLDAVRRRAAERGTARLVALFPEWSPWFARFQENGWLVEPTELVTTAVQHHATFDAFWLRDSWWYELGETDLV